MKTAKSTTPMNGEIESERQFGNRSPKGCVMQHMTSCPEETDNGLRIHFKLQQVRPSNQVCAKTGLRARSPPGRRPPSASWGYQTETLDISQQHTEPTLKHKTKQNKTKQYKTKQNKTKHPKLYAFDQTWFEKVTFWNTVLSAAKMINSKT